MKEVMYLIGDRHGTGKLHISAWEKEEQHYKYGVLLRCCLEMAVKKGESVNDKIS